MADIKELNDEELEKVAGGAQGGAVNAIYEAGDLFYKSVNGWTTYIRIESLGDDSSIIIYNRKMIKIDPSGTVNKYDGIITEDELLTNYTKIESVPANISFD